MDAKRYAVVLNPRGGTRRGAEILGRVRPVFDRAGAALEIHETTRAGHARELAQSLALEDCAGLCVVGGDGTIHEAVNGLMHRADPSRVPLGVIPGGSGNTVAEHLGCLDPVEAARRIVAGRVRPLDVARLTTGDGLEFCVNIIGWGAAVDINRRAERLRWLGPSRYTLAALWQILRARRRRARLTLDGAVVADDFFLIVGCNTKYTGRGMMLAPRAETDDGLLDVVVVRRATRRQMVALFRRVFDGSHLSLGCVECHRVRSFSIEPDARDVLNLDGELKATTPVAAAVVPSALRVFAS